MYGSLLSVLFLGMLPAWGGGTTVTDFGALLGVAPPSLVTPQHFDSLNESLTASGVVIVDLDSGQTVYEHGADKPRPMASLTKLMTALLIIENHALDEIVSIPPKAADVVGTDVRLPINNRFSVGDLLSALLIPSANDAAYALAMYDAGSMEDFSEKMNQRAKELGLTETSYENSIGFDDTKQQSSPRDLALLAMTVLRHDAIRERMSLQQASIRSLEGNIVALYHSHQLLDVPLTASVTGSGSQTGNAIIRAGKTGTTDDAGQCLLSIVEARGRRYVAVLLHSKDRYADMRAILLSLNK